MILNYFISETAQIPNILVTPPADYDPNTRIDEDGHSALHWACAMGRVRVVKLLLTAGASIFAANNAEQTPLMRSVMFSNNYDMRKFPELYELLHRSTLNIDRHNRTVFHHIANLALIKGKTHAARYYMETILIRLADFPQELADVINFQDEDGETALTLAARARSRRLVKSLLDHGADPKIKNRDLKSAEDYILEDERFRTSPVAPGRAGAARESGIVENTGIAHQLYSSEAARMAGGACLADMTTHMQSLAKSFDAELAAKERDILQAKALLTGIHAEVTEASRLVQTLEQQSGGAGASGPGDLSAKRTELEGLMSELRDKVGAGMARGYERWEAAQVDREEKVKRGEMVDADVSKRLQLAGQDEEASLRWQIDERRRRRQELVDEYVKVQAEVCLCLYCKYSYGRAHELDWANGVSLDSAKGILKDQGTPNRGKLIRQAGTGEKIAQYRRLISAGLGGSSSVEEVDRVMDQLLSVSHALSLLVLSLANLQIPASCLS
jgi:hypothetical protein